MPATLAEKRARPWAKIQDEYERGLLPGGVKISLRNLAKKYGVPAGLTMQRAAREHWSQSKALFETTQQQLKEAVNLAVNAKISLVADKTADKMVNDLAPYIEREKRAWIMSQVERGKRGVARVDKITPEDKPLDPKGEAFVAQSVDRWDTIVRRNLGMNDTSATIQPLSISVLGGHTAIQINTGPVTPNESPNESHS